jgi:hypothetical protein
VRVIGILLIVQAFVRFGFLLSMLNSHGSFLNYPLLTAVQLVIIPAILMLAGFVTGIFALLRFPATRGFGLTFCALGLLYQLFGVAKHLPCIHASVVQLVLDNLDCGSGVCGHLRGRPRRPGTLAPMRPRPFLEQPSAPGCRVTGPRLLPNTARSRKQRFGS